MLSHSPSAVELRKFLPMIGCHTMTVKKENFNAVNTMLKALRLRGQMPHTTNKQKGTASSQVTSARHSLGPFFSSLRTACALSTLSNTEAQSASDYSFPFAVRQPLLGRSFSQCGSQQAAGTGLHMTIDRPSLQFAISVVVSGMSEPKVVHQLHVVRVARFVLQHR